MPASLSFKNGADGPIVNADIKKIVYEDNTGNKYTFGVDNANVFNTFKYDPNGADPEVDYSATAKNFMTGGAIAALLAIKTNVGEIKTKTDFIPDTFTADVTAIKGAVSKPNLEDKLKSIQDKTGHIPDTLGADVTAIKAKTVHIPDTFTADVTAIKAKTDNMPDNLVTELGTLAKSAELAPLVAPLAKSSEVNAIKVKTDTIPADLTAKVTAIETATNAAHLGDKLTAINTATNAANLGDKLTAINTATNAANLGDKVTAINAKITDTLGADVTAIKAKTDKIPADLGTELGKLATSAALSTLDGTVATIKTETDKITAIGTNVGKIETKTDKIPADLGADVTAIKAKTDKIPTDLNAELIKLTAIGNAINGNGNVTEAAKLVLESSFKEAITRAGTDGSDWLKKSVTDIVSQPKFDIPVSDDVALDWTW